MDDGVSGSRRRYAIVGTGGRAAMYLDALCDTHAEHGELVALCDPSATRMRFHNERIAHKYGRSPIATYDAADFDRMVAECRPDVVIVTTVDAVHHVYIVRAMELGCDVVTEKPMTTTAASAAAISDARRRTGRSLRVTFNYRYIPLFSALKELVAGGAIGTPQLVHFSWTLDTWHGADYFRRWHRERDSSGGLLVHKATHHFDLVNWWIDAWPAQVGAVGGLNFYGSANAAARGERYDYDRYTGEAGATEDPFALDLTWSRQLRGLYLDAEAESGYRRDQNVFGDGISIEDTMAVTARYGSGALLAYSLVAYSPTEGLRVDITGDRGRVELAEHQRTHIIGEGAAREESAVPSSHALVHYPMFGAPVPVDVPAAEGGHGGGDARLLDDLFSPDPPADPLGRAASADDGAAALVLGLAANRSIETGAFVDCADVVALPERPARAAPGTPHPVPSPGDRP